MAARSVALEVPACKLLHILYGMFKQNHSFESHKVYATANEVMPSPQEVLCTQMIFPLYNQERICQASSPRYPSPCQGRLGQHQVWVPCPRTSGHAICLCLTGFGRTNSAGQ